MTVSCPPLIEVTCDACTAHTISCAKLVIHLQNIFLNMRNSWSAEWIYLFHMRVCPISLQVVLMLHVVKQLQGDLPFTIGATSSNGTAIHDDVGHLDSPTSHNIHIKERFTAGPQMIQWYNPWTTLTPRTSENHITLSCPLLQGISDPTLFACGTICAVIICPNNFKVIVQSWAARQALIAIPKPGATTVWQQRDLYWILQHDIWVTYQVCPNDVYPTSLSCQKLHFLSNTETSQVDPHKSTSSSWSRWASQSSSASLPARPTALKDVQHGGRRTWPWSEFCNWSCLSLECTGDVSLTAAFQVTML